MKKLHSLPLEKILLFCGFSLALTLAGFWQYQHNVGESEKISRVQNGVSTCFSRVTQSFTAAMIKEFTSPYLKRDFMALSDECLREGTKASGLEVATLPKAGATFNDLISEVYWFHEKVVKVLGSVNVVPQNQAPMQAISEKYAKVEGLKLDLQDQLDLIVSQYREARLRDEVLVGCAFLLFIASLGVLGLKEASLLNHKRSMEKQALSLLNAGHSQVGAMVDQLVQKALTGQGMPISSQVFSDYHSNILEQLSYRKPDLVIPEIAQEPVAEMRVENKVEASKEVIIPEIDARKILTSQAIRLKAEMEVQEAMIQADAEMLAQLVQAFGQRFASGKVKLIGKRENDTYRICIVGSEVCFNASELNYTSKSDASMDGVDVNLIIAMDIIRENSINAEIKNQKDTNGVLIGSSVEITLPMNPNRTLVNIVRGKKKDLAKALSPAQFN
ncbi:MAG: hypothetical protein K2P81_12135 [Bacteriovoracaceae bacterium]|nr:hypothetical protein [Bacteriovoracaceae bacterium]